MHILEKLDSFSKKIESQMLKRTPSTNCIMYLKKKKKTKFAPCTKSLKTIRRNLKKKST